MTTRGERVHTADGEFDAHVELPESGSGPGLLLIQEIFGVNEYVKQAAQRLAALGYVVLAPDLYWRTQPGLSLSHGPEEQGLAFAAAAQLDARPMFHEPEAAARAWELTSAFLARSLPPD